MLTVVDFCDQEDCVFWKEPNSCESDAIELGNRLCVTFMTEEDSKEQEKWLQEVIAARKEPRVGKHSKDLDRLSDEDALRIKMSWEAYGC